VQRLFADELRRLDYLDEDPGQWETPTTASGKPCGFIHQATGVAEFLLHIDGDNA
jgi:hypothetical protein